MENEVREAGYEMTTEGWFRAVSGNDVVVMRKMVEGDFDDKTKDAEGNSGLHVAAASGSKEAAEYLLNKGHSVDMAGAGGRTPLMEAVLKDQPEMVKWLLRQGADSSLKDNDGFIALMMASAEGKPKSVEELASHHGERQDLDSALLLAALVGHADVIDILTKYGGSVYARMEDGRTPLMLAAENGHKQVAALLIDIGASRFATLESGETAQSFAVAAGNNEIAEMIESGFTGDNLAFETDEEVAEAMVEYVEVAENSDTAVGNDVFRGNAVGDEERQVAANNGGNEGTAPWNDSVPGQDEAAGVGIFEPLPEGAGSRSAPPIVASQPRNEFRDEPRALNGIDPAPQNDGGAPRDFSDSDGFSPDQTEEVQSRLRRPVSNVPTTLAGARIGKSRAVQPSNGAVEAPENNPEIPLIMRHYRQRELPVEVKQVSGGVASLRLVGAEPRDIQVRGGDTIPGSNLVVVRVFSRTEEGKLNNNQPIEVGIVEVEDSGSGQRREWIAGRSASGHDPVALVEDAATGQRYVAKPGQKFTSEDGREFIVNDVRPSQLVIEDANSGEVRTLRLRGSRG